MFDTRRRINRTTFFVGGLLAGISVLGFALLSIASIGDTVDSIPDDITVGIFILWYVAALYYSFVLTKQRSNDIDDRNAVIIAVLSFLFTALPILLIPGQKRPNKYGEVPAPGVDLMLVKK